MSKGLFMDNRDDFANRLNQIASKKTVAISRSTSVTPKTAMSKAKKQSSGGRSFVFKILTVFIVSLAVFRSLSFISDIDLEQRRANLVDGNSQEKQAAFVLSVVMVADPLIETLMDKNTYMASLTKKSANQKVASNSGTDATNVALSNAQQVAAIEETNTLSAKTIKQPSMVVNGVKRVVGANAEGATLLDVMAQEKKAEEQDVSYLQRVFAYLKP